jgi:hypothetical protein
MVLGMHRSGTSWLAGELHQRGVPFGDVNMSSVHNERGNRENLLLVGLHNGVLEDSGGAWNRPPRRVQWSEKRQLALREFIRRMDARFPAMWGFKDPRALLVLDEWRRQLGERLLPVGVFRDPNSVAASLLQRQLPQPEDRIRDRAHALELWNAYCEPLAEFHRGAAFPLFRFDPHAPGLSAQVDANLHELQRTFVPAPAQRPHFAPELVHHTDVGRVPRRCRRVWAYLTANQVV